MDMSYFLREWTNHYLHQGYTLPEAKRLAVMQWNLQMDIPNK